MSRRYAESTSVSVAKSKAEIEALVGRYGADSFAQGWENERATVGFRMRGKYVRFNLTLPQRTDAQFTTTPSGRDRKPAQAEKAWEQTCRSSWRALALVIKAKLEAVELGITTFEEEFLAHLVLPGGRGTVGENLIPQIEAAYADGKTMPKLLPYGGSK